MQDFLKGLIESLVPLVGGIIPSLKLRKDKSNKIYYLGPVLLLIAILIILKSVAGADRAADSDREGQMIATKLKGKYSFPVKVDELTTLNDIRVTSEKEISYFYVVLFDDLKLLAKEPIIEYACANANYEEIYKRGYTLAFVYSSTEGKLLDTVKTSKDTCKK